MAWQYLLIRKTYDDISDTFEQIENHQIIFKAQTDLECIVELDRIEKNVKKLEKVSDDYLNGTFRGQRTYTLRSEKPSREWIEKWVPTRTQKLKRILNDKSETIELEYAKSCCERNGWNLYHFNDYIQRTLERLKGEYFIIQVFTKTI